MTDILEGETLSATATAQTFRTGDGTVRHTLINDGDNILFYRALAKPGATTATGTEAELRALSYNELKVGDAAILPATSRPIQYVCGTSNTTTARVIAGSMVEALNLSIDADLGANLGLLNKAEAEIDPATEDKQDDIIADTAAIETATEATQAAVEKSTADVTSVMYEGGSTSPLQLEANSAAVVAGGAAVIDADGANAIDIQLVNAAANESCTLLVTEYSAATPTVATQIRQVEISIPATNLAAKVDLQMVGLATATGYAKTPVRVAVTPGAYVMISLAAESAAGAKYARYQLLGSV